MNNFIFLLLSFIVFSVTDLSAQSACCKAITECKPQTCCPSNPTCCSETNTSLKSTKPKNNKNAKAILEHRKLATQINKRKRTQTKFVSKNQK